MNRYIVLAISAALAFSANANIETPPSMDDAKYNVTLSTGLIPTQLPKITELTYDANGNPNYAQLYGYTTQTKEYSLDKAIDAFDTIMTALMSTGIFQKKSPDWTWDDKNSVDSAQRAIMSATFLSDNLAAVIGSLANYCQDVSKKVNLNANSWERLHSKIDKMNDSIEGVTYFRDQTKKGCEDAYEKINAELVQRIENLESEITALKERQMEIGELKDTTIPNIEARISKAESDISKIDLSLFVKVSDLTSLQTEVATAQSTVSDSLTQISTLNDSITTHSQTLITLLRNIDDIQTRLTDTHITEQERSQLESQISAISTQVESIQETVSGTQTQVQGVQTGIAAQSASIEGLLSQIDTAKAAIEGLKEQRTALETEKASIQTELDAAKTRLEGIEKTASEQEKTINQNQQNISSASLLLAALQKSVDAIGAGATKESGKEILQPLIMGGVVSPADCNFTNAMYALVKYLGVKDGDHSVTNSGLTFVAPKVNGNDAATILEYMNLNGVVGYQDPEAGVTNSPFSAKFVSAGTSGTNVLASFGAPVNWIDGTTIKLNNDGTYSAQVPTPAVTTPWHWTTNGFERPYVYAGNQIVTASGANVTSAGEYYVHVTMSQAQGGGYTVSAVVNTSSDTSDDSWTFWVGTLQDITHDVDGTLVTETVCTAELGVMPVILCYE